MNTTYIKRFFFRLDSVREIFDNMRIGDIYQVHTDGSLLALNQLKDKLNINISCMEYNTMISAIPNNWKVLLKNQVRLSRKDETCTDNEPSIKIRQSLKSVSKTLSKEMYKSLIIKIIEPPSALETWIDMYPFLTNLDWEAVYMIPFKVMREPYFQSFQYKIINRILNTSTREKLYRCKITQNNLCQYCKMIDTLEHHIFHCPVSLVMWKRLEDWISENLEITYKLTECEVIFGIPMDNSADMDIINYLIIMCKWYINKNKCMEKSLHLFEFLHLINERIHNINHINISKGMEPIEWHDRLCSIL